MNNHELRILKFLSDNPELGPSIMDLMNRLNISIEEIGPSLDSMLKRQMVAIKIDNQGVEHWFPTATSGAFTSLESAPPAESIPEPASAMMPTTSFAELTSDSRGVGLPMLLISLLIMGDRKSVV